MKPSGNEVVSNVRSQVPRGESFYFTPERVAEHERNQTPDPNAQWTPQRTIALPPCNDDAGHNWEVLLRCTRCGFLIRLANTPHDLSGLDEGDAIRQVRLGWERACACYDDLPSHNSEEQR